MIIEISDGTDPALVCERITGWIENTRFRIEKITVLPPKPRSKVRKVSVLGIRLKVPARYYGFGPNRNNLPMMRSGWRRSPPKPVKVSFLGGLDWIEFNDTLNDIFDHFNMSARIYSSHCVVRKGMLRRLGYDLEEGEVKSAPMHTSRSGLWQRNGVFVDGTKALLMPFSSCNANPGGQYRMFCRSPLTP